MLKRAGYILLVLAIAAICAGFWRGRIASVPTAESLERVRVARAGLKLLNMREEIGGALMSPEFVERERAASAQLAIAEYDAATNEAGRLAAVKAHLQRMENRATRLQRIPREDWTNSVGQSVQVQQNVAMARLLVRLLAGS